MAKKRGRPRKEGPRYANGRLKPYRETIAPTLAYRVLEHAKKMGVDPRLGSELGRLFLHERITGAEYSAGVRFAEVYGRAAYYNGCKRTAKSPSWEAGFKQAETREVGTEVADTAEESLDNPTAYEYRAMASEGSLRAIHALFGPRQIWILEWLCVDDLALGPSSLPIARDMLQKLIIHFGMEAAPPKQKQVVRIKKVEKIRADIKPLREVDYAMGLLQRLRPDLSRDCLMAEWSNFCALRDRDIFRGSRENTIGAL